MPGDPFLRFRPLVDSALSTIVLLGTRLACTGSRLPSAAWKREWASSSKRQSKGTDVNSYIFKRRVQMRGTIIRTVWLVIAGVVIGLGATTQAGVLQVVGSLEYDPATNTGLTNAGMHSVPGWAVNNNGTAAGAAWKYDSGTTKGTRAMRWDASGTATTELGTLGFDNSGTGYADAYAVNAAGTIIGTSDKYVGGVDKGTRPVRWNASGTVAVELGVLGTSSNGFASSLAWAINDVGAATGYSQKYTGGQWMGARAVRWDASGTAATELGCLGTDSNGYACCRRRRDQQCRHDRGARTKV